MSERIIKTCKKHGETEYAYYNNRWKCLKCQTESTQKRRDKVKYMAVAYKGGKCHICGYDKCIGALEFHHIDPNEKDFGISSNGYTHSWEKITQELNKCVLLCANCHREVHAKLITIPTDLINDQELANQAEIQFNQNC